jgi:glycosyltransferase involved in cell wall biosynthesis
LSDLDNIIAPEIKDDDFYRLISRLCREERPRHILEIGSSAGQGSTNAFFEGIRDNDGRSILFCVEVSGPRFEKLRETYADSPFVVCYNASTVAIDDFPKSWEIARFYVSEESGLNRFPLPLVLSWLDQDIEYVRGAGVPTNAIDLIKADHGIEQFDMVLIDGSEFTGSVELDRVYGAKFILLDDTNTYKCFAARQRLLADPAYEVIADDQTLRNGFSAFRRRRQGGEMPIDFFTIVLNGEPFIRYHEHVLAELDMPWHWHIVEGVATLIHDTAWSLAGGGSVTDELHDGGLSKDGTSAYLDDLAARYPGKVTIYRPQPGQFWNGKREMVNAPLPNIKHDCLLFQIDSDELWTARQISEIHRLFLANPERHSAFFWCDYFVGPEKIISTRYNYAQNPNSEWLRVWRYRPGMVWAAHEPPMLVRDDGHGREINVGLEAPLWHGETEQAGLVFQHFAYVTEAQLRFKEVYYGYTGAVEGWRRLQQTERPDLLRNFFPWVTDGTVVDGAAARGIHPLARPVGPDWGFMAKAAAPVAVAAKHRRIVIDCVVFQYLDSGISRVWRGLLSEWAEDPDFADQLVVLDRQGTAPRISGLHYRTINAHDYARTGADSLYLQKICDEEGAELFVSSYYTTPTTTASVFFGYDMIPEVIGANLAEEGWLEKHRAIEHAGCHIMISQSSANDLERFFPAVKPGSTIVAHCGLAGGFGVADSETIAEFRERHGLTKPYLLGVGDRTGVDGYKNGLLIFKALAEMPEAEDFDLLLIGGRSEIEPELAALQIKSRTVHLRLSDSDLKSAYSGAAALVYPSRYEGFGLPILEAMACGCPVITCANSSIPEVVGSAARFINADSAADLIDAIREVSDPATREKMIAAGLRQTQQFSTSRMAETVKRALLEAPIKGPAQIWTDFRKVLQASQEPRSAFDTIAAVETPWTVEAMPPVLTGVSGDVSRWDPPSASVAPAPSVAPSFRGKLRNLRNRLFGAGEVIEQTMARQQRMEEALRAEISANFVLQRSYMQSYMSAVLNEIKQMGDTLSAEMQGSRSAVHQEAQATRNTVAAEMRALRAMLEPPPVKPFTETVTRLRPDVNQKIGASD